MGLRVLDFSSFIAGAFAAQYLGDLGAEVVKVESLQGDAARSWGPFLAGESRLFQGWNRNKRSIAIDLQSDDGREAIYRLVRRADIVIENFRPGIVTKLGIDYASLRALNPRLIYLSITAFGATGPSGKRPGYDPILQALSGAARGNLRYCKSVGICSVAISDFGSALIGASGILAALYHRERTGVGQKIETSLLQAAMALQSHMFVKALDRAEEPPFGIFPYNFFETKDDIIFLAIGTDRFWQLLCEGIGAPELGADANYATNPQRVAHTEALTAALVARLRTRTTKEWEAILLAKGVPCAPAQTYEEFFDDPQVAAMNMNPVLDHATIGPLKLAGVSLHLSETPGAIQCAPPTLGQHTDEIMREAGYSVDEVARLRQQGILR
jgi:crotonobetainyl-CoA:carnitine CoA-transferase CaiB-like acyl-CoA transferase